MSTARPTGVDAAQAGAAPGWTAQQYVWSASPLGFSDTFLDIFADGSSYITQPSGYDAKYVSR